MCLSWINPVNVVVIFASVAGIIFLIHRLLSEPYSVKVDVPSFSKRTNKTEIVLQLTNLTGYSINTTIEAQYFINQKPVKTINFEKDILAPNVNYEYILSSLKSISDENQLSDGLFVHHPLKLILVIFFKNRRYKVLKFNKSVKGEWLWEFETKTFKRIK